MSKYIQALSAAIQSGDEGRLVSCVEGVKKEIAATDKAKRMLEAILLGKNPLELPPPEKEVNTMSDMLVKIAEDMNCESEPPVPTGLKPLDDMIGGLAPSELFVIGARPGDGKTSLALSIAYRASLLDYPVLVFSYEQPAREITNKFVCMNSSCPRVPVGTLRSRRWHPDLETSYLMSAQQVEQLPIFVYDLAPSVAKIAEHISSTKEKVAGHGCKETMVVIVDYIQLFPTNEGSNRTESLSEVSRAMKQLAKEHKCVILLVSQLNRESTKKDNVWDEGIPAAFLRETGSLEQDADGIFMIVRREDVARIHLVKMRACATGFCEVHFHEPTTLFSS